MNKLTKALALLLVLSTVFAFAACGKDKTEGVTTVPEDTAAQTELDETTAEDITDETGITDAVTEAPTEAEITTVSEEITTVAEVTTAADETTTAADPDKLPETTEEILAAYTEVMNKSKAAKPGYTMVEWQALPEDKRDIDGGIANTLLKLAGMFMTTEEKAKKDPIVKDKNGEMKYFPVLKSEKGCYLTDVSKIKNASCKKQDDGTIKITIELKPEMNSQPYYQTKNASASAVGAMFGPISKADIDKELTGNKAVKIVVKDVDYDLKYYNCIATIVYDPETKLVKTVSQLMDTLITINSGKVLGSSFTGSAVLHDDLKIYDIKY